MTFICAPNLQVWARPSPGDAMEFYRHGYVPHGTVALESDRVQTFALFRKDAIENATGCAVAGNELWLLQSSTGPIVVAINADNMRFRGEQGTIYVLMARG